MIIEFILLFLSIIMFFKSKNLIVTLLVFFLLLFYIQVVFVELIFGMDFSQHASKFDYMESINYAVSIFVFIVFIFNYNIDTNFDFKHKFIDFKIIDLLSSSLIITIATYLLITKGVRIDGSFGDSTGVRYVIEDYIFLPVVVILVTSRGRFLVTFAVIILLCSYLLAGERMRMFVYLFVLYAIFVKHQNSNYFRLSLFLTLAFAMLLSMLRSNFNISNEYHITHFGSVTISSMYLMDFSVEMDIVDKAKYFMGIIIGNIIPSSILPEGYDIRRDLVDYANIPGGGWFPVLFFALAGYSGLIIVSLTLAIAIRVVSLNIKRSSSHIRVPLILFFMVFVATLPRWFMYTPYQFFRFPMYIVIIYIFYILIQKLIINTNLKEKICQT